MEQDRLRSARTLSKPPASRAGVTTTATRPITQQGLGGARPIQTGIGKMNRMCKDKKYYISMLHSHMTSIREELTTLQKNTAYNRAILINHTDSRMTAESSAKNYTKLQEMLSTYNAVIELQASQEGSDKLIYETVLLKERNKTTLTELDALVNNKLHRDDIINMLQKALSEEDFKMQTIIDNFTDQNKIRYIQTVGENERLVNEIKDTQTVKHRYKDAINKYEKAAVHNKLRQQKILVSQELSGAKEQRDNLLEELGGTLTTSQQKELLIQQVKNCKTDTESLLKVKVALLQELEEKKEKLQLLESELNEKNGSRLKKHKELRERGEQMAKFIATFGEKSGNLREKMDAQQHQLLQALNQLTDSVTELNFEELDNLQLDLNQSSIESLSCQHDLIASRIKRLTDFQRRYRSETESVKKKHALLQSEIETFSNSENTLQKLQSELQDANEKCKSLKRAHITTADVVTEVQQRQTNLEDQLKTNELYDAFRVIEIQLDTYDNETTNLRSSLSTAGSSEHSAQRLQTALALAAQINEQLVVAVRSRKHKITEEAEQPENKDIWQDI